MLDFEIQRCTRRCAATERELQPGEAFYSVLMSEGANVVRYDYGTDAWTLPPDNALGWWKSRMPEPNAARKHWAPNDVMLHYLDELEAQPACEDERYILALLLLRRRVVKIEQSIRDEAGNEVLELQSLRSDRHFRVKVALPTKQRAQEIQDKLAQLFLSGGPAATAAS